MVTKKKLPFLDLPLIHKPLKKQFLSILSQHIDNSDFTLGNSVNIFEKNFAKFNKINFSVGISSGTDALILALKALDIGHGDEVITTSHTWISTIFAINIVGATPKFIDVEYDTFNIDTNLIEKSITKKTKAILPVHMYGLPCDMHKLTSIAKKHNIKIIEDCSQAHGATIGKDKRNVGTFGDINTFSFYPSKNIGALGEAGCCTTFSKKYYIKLIKLRNMGQILRDKHDLISGNHKIDSIQASFLNLKLSYLKNWNQSRKLIANLYDEYIDNKKIIKPTVPINFDHVYHQYVIKVKNRKKLTNILNQNNIPYMFHYTKEILKQKMYKKLNFKTPNTNKIYKEIISLPCYPGLKMQHIKKIAKILNKF